MESPTPRSPAGSTWDGEDVVPRPHDRFLGLEGALRDFVGALRNGSLPPGECHDNLRSLPAE